MKKNSPAIPIFKLYGEASDWLTPDLIHCESIAERSRQHNWEIRPHRHSDLVQLLYLQEGEATAQLDGTEHVLQPPCLLLVAKMCVHSFRFSSNVKGYVLSLASPLLKQLSDQLGSQHAVMLETGYYSLQEEQGLVDTLFATLDREYTGSNPGRELLLESLVNAIMVLLSRHGYEHTDVAEQPQDRSSRHFARFSQMVEQHYKAHRTIEEYAKVLGITAAHLNTLCQRFAGRTALQLTHERLMLEAKRDLIYTSKTIGEVSDNLGFSEPAYFTRFFKRTTGLSPKAYRKSSGTQ